MVLVLCLVLPFTMLVSSCGATPTNDANAVTFVSEKYDSQGRAVFEVDLDTPTKLTYKVNPSTWSGYTVTYSNDANAENRRRFVLSDSGVIRVSSKDDGANFKDLVVEISINGHKDSCVVKLKKYPNRIYVTNPTISVSAQGMVKLDVYGEFAGETTPRTVTESEYKFRVTSSDVTKIQVPNSDRLTLHAVCPNSASVKVTVELLDTTENVKKIDETELKFEVIVNVFPNADRFEIKLDGASDLIKENGENVSLSASGIAREGVSLVVGFKVLVLSDSNTLLGEVNDVVVSFDDLTSISTDKENSKILINTNADFSEGYTFKVSVTSKLTNKSGNPLKLEFTVTISD